MDDPSPTGPEELGGLPDDVRAQAKAELAPGERLLWAARPVARSAVGRGGAAAALYGLACWIISAAAFAAFAGAFGRRFPKQEGLLFAVGFIAGAIGLLILAGVVGGLISGGAKQRARKLYAVTD